MPKRSYTKHSVGSKYGRLVYTSKLCNGLGFFTCDCGNTKIILRHNVLSGTTVSCGCIKKEVCGRRQRKKDTREYKNTETFIRKCRECGVGTNNYFKCTSCWAGEEDDQSPVTLPVRGSRNKQAGFHY